MGSTNKHIPEDLVVGILLRLPPATLPRFRCVSKSWNSLLSDPTFVHQNLFSHQNDAAAAADGKLLVKISHRPPRSGIRVYAYTCLPLDHHSLLHKRIPKFRDFPDPLARYCWILGSSGGSICFSHFTGSAVAIGLFNPATSESKFLPPVAVGAMGSDGYGFGFLDERHYKVVRICGDHSQNNCSTGSLPNVHVHVYDSSRPTDAWRKLGGDPLADRFQWQYDVFDREEMPQSYTGGGKNKCYWIVRRRLFCETIFRIVSFDSETLQNPCGGFQWACARMLKEESMVVFNRNNELWVLHKLGVSESWCKLFRFEGVTTKKLCRPLALSRCGKVIFEDPNEEGLRILDVVTRKTYMLPITRSSHGSIAEIATYDL